MKGITGNPVLDAYGRMAVSPVGAARPTERAEPSANPVAGPSSPAADITISSQARDLAADASRAKYDAARVESLKSQIQEGSFKVNSKVVAQRLLEATG